MFIKLLSRLEFLLIGITDKWLYIHFIFRETTSNKILYIIMPMFKNPLAAYTIVKCQVENSTYRYMAE